MGMIACYQMADAEMIKILKGKDEEERFEIIEELQEECAVTDIDKMWDGLHFLLTGVSATEPIEDNALSEAVVGKEVFSDEEDADFIACTNPEDIEVIVQALEAFDISKAVEDFEPEKFAKKDIYPNIWMREEKEGLQEELRGAFEQLKDFYNMALEQGKGVVVSIY